MGKSWKDDDWHDMDEMWEEEQRKKKRHKREFIEPDAELGEPKKAYADTFSAQTVMLDTYFKKH